MGTICAIAEAELASRTIANRGKIVNGRHFQRLGSWTFVLKGSTRAELEMDIR